MNKKINQKINVLGILIILLSLGIIAVNASIQTAFMTGLVTSLVATSVVTNP